MWSEGPYLQLKLAWNSPERATGYYNAESWPQAELAADRLFVLAARQVFRDEWDINAAVAEEHGGAGFVALYGTETNYYREHSDYPVNTNMNFIWPRWSGGVNTHYRYSPEGHVREAFLIWSVDVCPVGEFSAGQTQHPPPGEWWAAVDDGCRVVWLQRWTAAGEIELKQSEQAPVYSLRVREVRGDLGVADVLVDMQEIYTVEVLEYDASVTDGDNMRMVVQIIDHRSGAVMGETFVTDPPDMTLSAAGLMENWGALTEHTVEVLPLRQTDEQQ